MSEECITFTDCCFMIYDTEHNAVRSTSIGHLAAFSTREVAEAVIEAQVDNKFLIVVPVYVTPVTPREGETQ